MVTLVLTDIDYSFPPHYYELSAPFHTHCVPMYLSTYDDFSHSSRLAKKDRPTRSVEEMIKNFSYSSMMNGEEDLSIGYTDNPPEFRSNNTGINSYAIHSATGQQPYTLISRPESKASMNDRPGDLWPRHAPTNVEHHCGGPEMFAHSICYHSGSMRSYSQEPPPLQSAQANLHYPKLMSPPCNSIPHYQSASHSALYPTTVPSCANSNNSTLSFRNFYSSLFSSSSSSGIDHLDCVN